MEQQNENKLAYEIANTLNDQKSITIHLSFVKRYKPEFLKEILLRVMSIPDNKIRRSRAALYTYLVNEHGRNHSRD